MQELIELIQTNYSSEASKNEGRPPYPLPTMLRVHPLQKWYSLSDPAIEYEPFLASYDPPAPRGRGFSASLPYRECKPGRLERGGGSLRLLIIPLHLLTPQSPPIPATHSEPGIHPTIPRTCARSGPGPREGVGPDPPHPGQRCAGTSEGSPPPVRSCCRSAVGPCRLPANSFKEMPRRLVVPDH